MNDRLSGLIAAPFTPFSLDGKLALDVVPSLAQQLAHNRVNGAFVCGTTGEGYSLTMDERRAVAETWRKSAPDNLKLIVHVGHSSVEDSCALARHAQSIKTDAIATIAPSFFKPPSAKELVSWCQKVAGAAPDTPFYYYHMPAMTGLDISAFDFISEADGKIPTLAGVKFTYEDLGDFRAVSAFGEGRYTVLFGRDEILLEGLQLGAPGAVGSTYNYAAPLYHQIMQAFAAGDLETSRRQQACARQLVDIMERMGGLAAGKTIMKLIGIDCGPVRLPLAKLDAAQEAELSRQLQVIGFFDFASRV